MSGDILDFLERIPYKCNVINIYKSKYITFGTKGMINIRLNTTSFP